jgi:hypothetical protein
LDKSKEDKKTIMKKDKVYNRYGNLHINIGFTNSLLMEFICDSNKVENTNSDYLSANSFNNWIRLKRIKKLINEL